MKRSDLLLLACIAALVAGCASGPNSGGSAPSSEDKVYTTGSRLPQKDAPPPQATDKNTIDTIYRRSQVCVGSNCGGG